ncbi:MAG: hypothetical protein GX130_10055 [Candidatus Hydrogenedens sp.]|nr:hypothetical protein [Candidatus Hydrogenedens sp.]
MTDHIQVHSWGGAASKLKMRQSPSIRGPFVFFFLLLIVAAATWLFWPSPTGGEMESFIPADHGIEIYIHDPATRRSELMKNPLLDTIPSGTAAGQYKQILTRDLPLPGWLLNNLSSGLFHISLADNSSPNEILIITRMTRIGLFTEKFFSRSGRVTKERAGGLDLKKVRDAELYYSVRNKYLLLSPSRDILIRSLTLPAEEAIERKKFLDGSLFSREADVYCRFAGQVFSPQPDLFSDLSVALRLNQAVPRISVLGSFSDMAAVKYASLLQETVSEDALDTPLEGIASLSVNLGMPLPEWYGKLVEIESGTGGLYDWLVLPEALPEDAGATDMLQYLLATLFHSAGERFRLAWFGFDETEVLPAPLLAGTLEARTDALHAAYDLVPEPSLSNEMIDLYPHIDSEELLATLPFIGGENMTPSMNLYSQGVLLSSSEGLVRDLVQWEPVASKMGKKANLYFHLRPAQAWDAVVPSLCELAAAGLLRNHSEASFAELAQEWREQISPLQEIAFLGVVRKKGIHLEAKIALGNVAQDMDIDTAHFENREHS